MYEYYKSILKGTIKDMQIKLRNSYRISIEQQNRIRQLILDCKKELEYLNNLEENK